MREWAVWPSLKNLRRDSNTSLSKEQIGRNCLGSPTRREPLLRPLLKAFLLQCQKLASNGSVRSSRGFLQRTTTTMLLGMTWGRRSSLSTSKRLLLFRWELPEIARKKVMLGLWRPCLPSTKKCNLLWQIRPNSNHKSLDSNNRWKPRVFLKIPPKDLHLKCSTSTILRWQRHTR